MSNGTQCCALEICCDAPARRQRVARVLADFIGADIDCCLKVFDWMDQEGLVFAPASMQSVIDDVAKIARAHPAES